MEYIVSAENLPYHHWQLELLLASFRRYKLEDNLVIALAHNDTPTVPDFRKNLLKHPRLFSHDNVGRRRGFLALNKPFAVAQAVEQDLIQQPFTVIDPDMVLFTPVLQPQPTEHILFQTDYTINMDLCAEHGCDVRKYLSERLGDKWHEGQENPWLPLGSTFVFNRVPGGIFNRVVDWIMVFLSEAQKKCPGKPWKYTDRAGWAVALLEYYGHFFMRGVPNLEMTLLDNGRNNFIHYTHGLPPVFSKYMFRYDPPDYLAASESPFITLLQENPTIATHYMQGLVMDYLR